MKKVFLSLLLLCCMAMPAMAEDYPTDIPLPYQEKTTLKDTKNLFKIYISENNKFVLSKGSFDYYAVTVPVEFFSEKISPQGGKVTVEGDFVTLTKEDTVLKYRLGSNIVNANGKNISLLGRCYQLGDTIQIPLRFTLESFGGSITGYEQTFSLPNFMWFGYPKEEMERTAFISINRTKAVNPYIPKFSDNFNYFLDNYTSPDGKWRTKLCRLHDYDAVFLEDVERGLFYPIINNMRAKLGRSWLHDNRLHIQSCYVQYGPTWKHPPKDIYIYYVYDPVLKEMKKISKEESKRLKEETKRLVTYETSSTPNEILVRIK